MASLSKVQICNMALSHVGNSESIEALNDDTKEAKQCALWYDYARLQVLEAEDWDFARTRITGTSHGSSPPAKWAHRYQYPADAVKVLRLERENDQYPILFEEDFKTTRSIVTDEARAVIVYTKDEENVAVFSPKFVDALSWYLAYKIGFALSRKAYIPDRALAGYREVMGVSVGEDGQPQPAQQAPSVTDIPLDKTYSSSDVQSQIRISNMALAALGLPGSIESLTETTKQAKVAGLWYDFARKAVLEDYEWPFAIKRDSTSKTSLPSTSRWKYSYVWPSTCLKVLGIEREDDESEVIYEDEGRAIYTDKDNARIIYINDESTATKFTTEFTEAVALFMAYKMSIAFSGSLEAAQTAYATYTSMMDKMKGVVRNEQGQVVRENKRDREVLDRPDYLSSELNLKYANLALNYIGVSGSIQDLSENTKEARLVRLWYDEARRFVLEQHKWPFALKRAALTDITASQPPPAGSGWTFRYQYPSGAIKVWGITVNESSTENNELAELFQVEKDGANDKTILATRDDAVAIYVEDNNTESEWSATFIDAFCRYLGYCIAPRYYNKIRDLALLYQAFALSLDRAGGSTEGVKSDKVEARWIAGR